MSNPPVKGRLTIASLELDSSTEASLYLELIRIIEKDIDEIKEGDTKSGWTSWAIIGAIAGAFLLLFGETKKLSAFPTQEVQIIGLTGILLYTVVGAVVRSFKGSSWDVRPGRIRWSQEQIWPSVPPSLFRLLYFLVGLAIASRLPLNPWEKFLIIATLGFLALVLAFGIVLAFVKFPVGNNKTAQKWIIIPSLLGVSLMIISITQLAFRIRPPLGEPATTTFVIAGLIVAIILLFENLMSTTVASPLLKNLQDLRSDIIFLRVDIDEALRRYETLTEGEALPDVLQQDLGEVLKDFELMEYTQTNMNTLLDKMEQALTRAEDSPDVRKQKITQAALDKDSYYLHFTKCNEVAATLRPKLDKLTKRISRLSVASADFVSADTIRNGLAQRIQRLQAMEQALLKRYQDVERLLKQAN